MTATRLLQFFKQFGSYCDRCFAPLSQAHGLSMREINVLLFLINNPGYDTARSITEYRGISKSQVSQAVDFLAELGYLTRTPDAEDRRLIHLTLTAEGRALASQAQGIQLQCAESLLQGMSAHQRDQVQELWEIMMNNAAQLSGEVAL